MLKTTIVTIVLAFFSFGECEEHTFDYDLKITTVPGKNKRTMICFHGYGANYRIAYALKNLREIEATLVSFNFPEHDIDQRENYDPRKASFGTIDELLPALYVMKHTVIGQNLNSIDLYGFSAGGGVVINAIRVLNTSTYDARLKRIGIGPEEKQRLLAAIQKGVVILDTPLKSIEEIMDFRGSTDEFEILAKNYRDNDLRPIDSLKLLKGLSLDILLHFQENDEVLSNSDDHIYIERIKAIQPTGKVTVILGEDGGHLAPHMSLWRFYSQKMLQPDQAMKAGGFDVHDPAVYFMVRDAMRTDGAARPKMVASVLAGKGVDETKIVSQLSIPIAVVIEKGNNAIGIDHVLHCPYRNLWRNKVELLEGAQHAIVLQQADQFQMLLNDFLEGF